MITRDSTIRDTLRILSDRVNTKIDNKIDLAFDKDNLLYHMLVKELGEEQ